MEQQELSILDKINQTPHSDEILNALESIGVTIDNILEFQEDRIVGVLSIYPFSSDIERSVEGIIQGEGKNTSKSSKNEKAIDYLRSDEGLDKLQKELNIGISYTDGKISYINFSNLPALGGKKIYGIGVMTFIKHLSEEDEEITQRTKVTKVLGDFFHEYYEVSYDSMNLIPKKKYTKPDLHAQRLERYKKAVGYLKTPKSFPIFIRKLNIQVTKGKNKEIESIDLSKLRTGNSISINNQYVDQFIKHLGMLKSSEKFTAKLKKEIVKKVLIDEFGIAENKIRLD